MVASRTRRVPHGQLLRSTSRTGRVWERTGDQTGPCSGSTPWSGLPDPGNCESGVDIQAIHNDTPDTNSVSSKNRDQSPVFGRDT